MFKKLMGDRLFYKQILALAIPIMIQNGITNFVNMLDNVMVGKVGTYQMTGVAVSNQLIFVFNLCIFGAISGAGIFGAQFFGKNDVDGIRHTFRFKLVFCSILSAICILLFLFFGENLIELYLKEGTKQAIAASLNFGKSYLLIMLIGLVPYTIAQCYSSTLRETGEAVLPMIAGVIAIIINLILNYILIFGKFGAPVLGADGAAIATVISRFVELLIVVIYTAHHKNRNPFIIGAFKSLYVPFSLIKSITAKGLPLMLNETMWAAGMAMLNQCYSVRGIDVVAANNICQTFFNVFSVAFMAVGVAIGILLGQILGTGDTEKAKNHSFKLIFFSVLVSCLFAVIYIFAANYIPQIYNTEASIRLTAARLMQISAIAMPIDAFAHASYFTLRSGGKTAVTLIFDSGFMWVISVPAAFILSRFTSLSILPLFAIVQAINLIKCVLGYIFVKKGEWLKTIVN